MFHCSLKKKLATHAGLRSLLRPLVCAGSVRFGICCCWRCAVGAFALIQQSGVGLIAPAAPANAGPVGRVLPGQVDVVLHVVGTLAAVVFLGFVLAKGLRFLGPASCDWRGLRESCWDRLCWGLAGRIAGSSCGFTCQHRGAICSGRCFVSLALPDLFASGSALHQFCAVHGCGDGNYCLSCAVPSFWRQLSENLAER